MNGLAALGGLGVVLMGLLTVAFGLVIAGLGQTFEALKEIALNTRATAMATNQQFTPSRVGYGAMGVISSMMSVVSTFIVIGGLISTLVSLATMVR